MRHCHTSSQSCLRLANSTPRVGFSDDLANSGLIKTFVAVVAFENFEVRAQRTLGGKPVCLLLVDPAMLKRRFDTTLVDRQPFSLSKRLA